VLLFLFLIIPFYLPFYLTWSVLPFVVAIPGSIYLYLTPPFLRYVFPFLLVPDPTYLFCYVCLRIHYRYILPGYVVTFSPADTGIPLPVIPLPLTLHSTTFLLPICCLPFPTITLDSRCNTCYICLVIPLHFYFTLPFATYRSTKEFTTITIPFRLFYDVYVFVRFLPTTPPAYHFARIRISRFDTCLPTWPTTRHTHIWRDDSPLQSTTAGCSYHSFVPCYSTLSIFVCSRPLFH